MNKITNKQRLELLHNDFYRCGNIHIRNVKETTAWIPRLLEQLSESFAAEVRATNTRLSIAEIRSKDFIDSEGCFYDFRGQNFRYGHFLIHVYTHQHNEGGSASVTLIAEGATNG